MLAVNFDIDNLLLRLSRENFHFAPYMDKGCTVPSKNVYKKKSKTKNWPLSSPHIAKGDKFQVDFLVIPAWHFTSFNYFAVKLYASWHACCPSNSVR